MTERLVELLDDPAMRSTMGRSGRRWVKEWTTPARAAEQYEEVFDGLLAPKRNS